MRYEVRYGAPERIKIVKAESRDGAEGAFNTAKRFAEKHGLRWFIALWDNGWLEKKYRSHPTDLALSIALMQRSQLDTMNAQ